jgi:hypothetical protein
MKRRKTTIEVEREALPPFAVAGESALAVAGEQKLADFASQIITEDDQAVLSVDHPLAIVSWLAMRPAVVQRHEIPNLLNETMGPLVFRAITQLLRTGISAITPVERVGRIYTLDVRPVGMPDPQVMMMVPVSPELEEAWGIYYQAVRHFMRYLVEGRERIERTSGLSIDVWGGTITCKTRKVRLPHLGNARRAFRGAIAKFIEFAPDVLTVEELSYVLSKIVSVGNGLGR